MHFRKKPSNLHTFCNAYENHIKLRWTYKSHLTEATLITSKINPKNQSDLRMPNIAKNPKWVSWSFLGVKKASKITSSLIID
jgi:hypothetical protein